MKDKLIVIFVLVISTTANPLSEELDEVLTRRKDWPLFSESGITSLFGRTWSLEKDDAQKNISYLVTNALNQIKVLMREGNSTYNIPQLDPYLFDEVNFTDYEGLKLTGRVEGDLLNLSDFNWEKLYICLFSLTFQASFNVTNLSLQGNYDINGSYYDIIPVYSTGNYSFNIDKFSFTITTNFRPARGDQPISLELLDININEIGNIKFDFGDIFGGGQLSQIVNAFTNDVSAVLLDRTIGLLEIYMTNVFSSGLQSQLNNVTIVEVIEYLNNLPE